MTDIEQRYLAAVEEYGTLVADHISLKQQFLEFGNVSAARIARTSKAILALVATVEQLSREIEETK